MTQGNSMIIKSIKDVLGGNKYPGRGIIIGKSSDSKNAIVAYWIMGRSKGSRNRIFQEDSGIIKTVPFDKSLIAGDPSLIIYTALRTVGNNLIVTNGDQTDTIANGILKGLDFNRSLLSRKYEHDAPNYTPRISSITTIENGVMKYELSILKTDDGNSDCVCRFNYSYENPPPGVGRLITTYLHDGAPLPSYCGEPVTVELSGTIDEFTNNLWGVLDCDNKVALFVRYTNIKTNEHETKIINKNQ